LKKGESYAIYIHVILLFGSLCEKTITYQNKSGRNQMNRILSNLLALSVFMAFCLTSAAFGTELSIPPFKAKPGDIIDVPLMIDAVDNLSGIKLVMNYDTEILTFKNAKKTKQTASLMHIVNSKKPGSLILVMAGAKGIQGKDFSILSLKFEVKKDLKGNRTTQIKIPEIQMMTDQLKDIKCSIRANPFTILAEGQAPEKPKEDATKAPQKAEKSEVADKKSEGSSEKPAKPADASDQGAEKPAKAVGKSEPDTKSDTKKSQ